MLLLKTNHLFFSLCLLIMSFSGMSCKTSLPKLTPLTHNPNIQKIHSKSPAPFITSEIKYVHSVQFTMPNGNIVKAIGLVHLIPVKDYINVILFTIEGLVILDAVKRKEILIINRSVNPFASRKLVQFIISDIRKIFIFKNWEYHTQGKDRYGKIVRRFRKQNTTTDITASPNEYKVISYNGRNKRISSIIYSMKNSSIHADKIIFSTTGLLSYKLQLELMRIE